MKKFAIALFLAAAFTHQAFAVSSFLANLHDKYIATGGALTTTTTSAQTSVIAGLVVFADNGEAYINIGSEEAKDALKIAVEKYNNNEALSEIDRAILDIYSRELEMSQTQLVEKVSADL